MEEKNSFDQLVSGLSSEERKDMLEKMQGQGGDPERESLVPVDTASDETISLELELKNESLFFRFWLWLKSLFTNTPAETLFNEHKVGVIARNIERMSPGLIDYKRKMLVSAFFNKLNELKKCADFFKPYCAPIDDDGDFYVFLGAFGMPQVAGQMETEVDPYSIPLDRGAKPEQRVSLLRRMDEVMSNIPADQKTLMYACARAAEWLLQFVRLPFNHLLSQFDSSLADEYICHFSGAATDLDTFARVLCNGLTIPKEVLEALFLYYQEKGFARAEGAAQTSAEQWIESAHNQLSTMHSFIASVPLRSLCRVVHGTVRWSPENFTGAEDWFVKYKMGWKRLFDQKWEAWSNDCKKEKLRLILQHNFGIETFPLLPERPWANLWGGLKFRYELTGGFLYWFFREVFSAYELTLKTVMLEGTFMQKENRVEFTEAFNELVQVSIGMESINRNCNENGEAGALFKKLAGEHTLPAQERAEKMLRNVESDLGHQLVAFGDACRKMDLLLTGIVGLSMDSRYDSLSNLGEIQGRDNALFRKRLQEAKDGLAHAYELIRELEPIDTPSFSK